MKTKLSFLGIVVGSLVAFTAVGDPSSPQISGNSERDPEDQKLAVIIGRVFAEDGGSPLAKATLSLRSKGAPPLDRPRTVRADSAGEYTFRDLEAGQYILRATRNGYVSRNYGQKTSYTFSREDVGTALTVVPGQVLENIDFHLIRAGVLEGRVMDQDNDPVERVNVTVNGYRSLGGNRRLLPFGRDDTDDRGQFRIFGIPPGNYYLSVSPRPFIAYPQREKRSFAPTYYPGVLRVEEAASIEVTPGGEVGGFNITVLEAFSYSVSGRVFTPEGKPAHSVWIMSMKESGKDLTSMMGPNTNTDLQGEFKVSGLLPGRHRLYARAGGGEDAEMASTTVDLVDRDLSGLTLVLGKGAEITGRFVVDGEASAVDWRRISLSMVSVGNLTQMSFGGSGAQVKEDLTFKISNRPKGTYRLLTKLPAGNHYVSSIRFDGQDITDRPIELRSNDRLNGVEIHISSEGARVSGYVEQAEGREVAEGATVLVFAADPQHRGFPSRFTRTTQTDQSGHFSLQGLVPAEYLVCALADHEAGREMDPDYLRSLERDSERINPSPGQTVQESLVALPAPKMN